MISTNERSTTGTNKKISVIMGVYNQNNFRILFDAVNSILNQTYSNFEFLIYNDGSNPEVSEELLRLSRLDKRIRILSSAENHGLAYALNVCIDNADGEYIARMDDDDISLPDRFEKQINFLENNPQYSWCGTSALLFDNSGIWGRRIMVGIPEAADYLRYSPYIHPSVMFRSDALRKAGGYHSSVRTLRCEDYELFMRMTMDGYKGFNLQLPLFMYREDINNVHRRKLRFRIDETRLRLCYFRKLGILFPFGWIYVLRPLAGFFIPDFLLHHIKRNETA